MLDIIEFILEFFGVGKKSNPIIIPIKPSEPILEIPTKEEVDNFPYLENEAHGIDISHHNENIDFSKIKQDFIFMKATEGVSFVSPVHLKRMMICMNKNIPCGSYHYYKPGIDPTSQAQHFCTHLMGDLPPVLDIEEMNGQSPGQIRVDLKIFLNYVESHTKKIPIIYTGYSFIKELKLSDDFARYPLWLAWYTTPEKVIAPAPWKKWTFWQYSESSIVDGVGKCDVNLFKK